MMHQVCQHTVSAATGCRQPCKQHGMQLPAQQEPSIGTL